MSEAFTIYLIVGVLVVALFFFNGASSGAVVDFIWNKLENRVTHKSGNYKFWMILGRVLLAILVWPVLLYRIVQGDR